MRKALYAVLMFVGLAACLPVQAQEAGAGTVAFKLKWPAWVEGNPPVLNIDGGGLLQLLIMAPEALQVIQGAAAGDDVKQKAADLQALLEQAKGAEADPAIVCAPQIAKIGDLEEELDTARAALTGAQTELAQAQAALAEAVAAKEAAEATAAEAAGKVAAAEAKASAAEAANADAQRVLDAVRGGIGTAVGALQTVADALNPPPVTPTN